MDDRKRGKRPSLPPLQTGSVSGYGDIPAEEIGTPTSRPTANTNTPNITKKPSLLTKTLRSLSNQCPEQGGSSSSMGTATLSSPPDAASTPNPQPRRRLPAVMDRLSRRVSKDSTSSSLRSDDHSSLRLSVESFEWMKILRYGSLAPDVHLLWSRSEYLVLTEDYLVKFKDTDSARATFPQLGGPTTARLQSTRSPSVSSSTSRSDRSERIEVPLGRIVAMFREEGSTPRFGIEIWWFDHTPAVSYSSAQFFFALPKERDDWLAGIRLAAREKIKGRPIKFAVPGNVQARIQMLVAAEEPESSNWALDVFPVVQRLSPRGHKLDTPEAMKRMRDGSSYYLVLGQNVCFLVRVFRASTNWAPNDLVLRVATFGLTSLVKFKATMAPAEERFVIGFR
jgi:hypothetical protein